MAPLARRKGGGCDGRITAIALLPLGHPSVRQEGTLGDAGGRRQTLFTCGHDGFVRRWSLVRTAEEACKVTQEAEVDVIMMMGLHADEDERLLCLALSPPDTGKPILGNIASTSGRSDPPSPSLYMYAAPTFVCERECMFPHAHLSERALDATAAVVSRSTHGFDLCIVELRGQICMIL